MIDPAEHTARAAANRLAAEHGPGLALDVEAALHARGSTRQPEQYLDPISLASLVVSVAGLAWTVYTDLKDKTPTPSPAVVARTIRVRMRNDGELDPAQRDRIIDVVVDETFQAAQNPSSMKEDQMGAGAELIKKTYAAFGCGDVAAVLDTVAEDVEWSAPGVLPQGGQFQGRSGVLEFFQGIGGAWETVGLNVEAVGEVGEDLVVGIVRGAGTLQGGTPSGYGAVHVFTISEGKIVRFREYTDLDGPLI